MGKTEKQTNKEKPAVFKPESTQDRIFDNAVGKILEYKPKRSKSIKKDKKQ